MFLDSECKARDLGNCSALRYSFDFCRCGLSNAACAVFYSYDVFPVLPVLCLTAMQPAVTFSSTTTCCLSSGLTRRRTLGAFSWSTSTFTF